MTTVQHVISLMEQLAPRSYAESWDNVGLMVGDRNTVVNQNDLRCYRGSYSLCY